MSNTVQIESRTLKTPAAAKYLGLSAKTLRAWRLRGPDDPGLRGPKYITISGSCVLYERKELDAWLDAKRAITTTAHAS
jgi:predicted DNA-binding transcriptional regulator AlpA